MFDWSRLRELTREVAALDVGGLGRGELLPAANAVIEASASLEAALGHLLAELDVHAICEHETGLSTGVWFARQAGVPAPAGRDRVRVARALHDRLDQVDQAVTDGRLSWEHARVLADACHPRVAERVAGVQSELIGLARGAVFDAWRRQVRGIVSLLDDDGGHDPDDDLARNHLAVVPTVDGVTAVSGALAGEHAEVARHAIETMADDLFRRYSADHERTPDVAVPPRRTLRALAFVELCRRGHAVDLQSTACPRPDVTLVVRAGEPDQAVTGDGVPLADGTTRTLLCDPDLVPVIVDRLGVPLNMGRKRRHATGAQRRALAVRDGGCVFPGCDAPPSWTDAHHVRPHEHGGRTDLDNLSSLCRRHHGITRRTGWTMHATGNGRFCWTTPSGRTLHSQRHGRSADQPP